MVETRTFYVAFLCKIPKNKMSVAHTHKAEYEINKKIQQLIT
jgi:hypothetical protein